MRSVLRGADDGGGRLLRAGGWVARVRRWPGDPTVCQLVTVDHAVAPSPEVLRAWLDELAGQGVRAVRTGALGPTTSPAYLEVGFSVLQELALLRHDLRHVPEPLGSAVLRRLRREEVATLPAIDRKAFGPVWAMDLAALGDACTATPTHRVRVAARRAQLLGFAISGRAGRSTYLQRLAVDPAVQRRGIGRELTIDALAWARRHRATSMLVNTHTDNEPALALYRSLGFEPLSYGLAVLEYSLP